MYASTIRVASAARLIVRVHSGATLNQWDRVTALAAVTLLTLSVPAMAALGPFSSGALALGGAVILWLHFVDLRIFEETVLVLASAAGDPLAASRLFDFLRHLRFSDLMSLADWSEVNDLEELLALDPPLPAMIPSPVVALVAYLRS